MNTNRKCVLCAAYGQEPVHYEHAHACFPCRDRFRHHLNGIAEQWLLLDPTPGGTASEKVTGSREAPIGARVDVLDQLLPVGPYTDAPIRDLYRDQVGETPAAAVLDAIAKEWLEVRRERGLREHRPVPTVVNLCAWLTDRLDWACERLPDSIGDNATEIRALCGRLHALNGNTRSRDPEPLPATPCKKCGHIALVRVDTQVVCTNCSQYSGAWVDAIADAVTRMTDQQAA
ncbi:hypothetical protein [Glycomyces sp. NPDC048151]|uniref:hypothetical protein n=1 Tax=Glycomyces sp. NPDC048151 TaxID=3364002 RepID=UPI0037187808